MPSRYTDARCAVGPVLEVYSALDIIRSHKIGPVPLSRHGYNKALSDFPRLQKSHRVQRLSSSFEPPFASGVLWSTCRIAPCSRVAPQSWQRKPSLFITSNRLDLEIASRGVFSSIALGSSSFSGPRYPVGTSAMLTRWMTAPERILIMGTVRPSPVQKRHRCGFRQWGEAFRSSSSPLQTSNPRPALLAARSSSHFFSSGVSAESYLA